MIEGIYEVAYGIWNSLLSIAMTLFTTSPSEANGSVYEITQTLYNSISGVSIPIAELFFLIAIYKDVVGSPAEQQLRRMYMNLIQFAIILVVLTNLWDLMGGIMGFADGLTTQLGISADYTLSMSTELQNVIAEAGTKPEVSIELTTFGEDIMEFFSAWIDWILTNLLFFIVSLVTLFIIVASSISILSSAYQRIIKPLVVIPFSTITVAMASGTSEASRTSWNYVKTFFGLCISGAFMVICVKLGVALTNGGLVAFDIDSLDLHAKVLYISVQNAITPIIVSGLVKGADGMIAKIF